MPKTTILCVALVATVACSSDSSTAPSGNTGGPHTGSLAVTVGNAATATTVTVTGPNGFSKQIAATTVLTNLTPGAYTISAPSAVVQDSIVGTITDSAHITGSPATVAAGDTAHASVAFTDTNGTGGVWVVLRGAIVGYANAQLHAAGRLAPMFTNTNWYSTAFGVATDASGNVWVADQIIQSLDRFTPADLKNGNGASVTLSLVNVTPSLPTGLAFDAAGNAWIASFGPSEIYEIPASALGQSGSPTPPVVITGPALDAVIGLAFDKHGNLWAASQQAHQIVEYTAAQLAATGSPTPNVVLSVPGGTIPGPFALAFDAQGDLWFSNTYNTTVNELTPSQLATSGTPTPAATISVAATGIAFDHSGNLWVASDYLLEKYAASQLATGATPVATLTIESSAPIGEAGVGFVFDPVVP
jgi:sugar lactone lactonase YvrE